MNDKYVCSEIVEKNGNQICTTWQPLDTTNYSGYKLTNEQMGEFILAIAFLFATVAVFKIVRRSFF